MPQDYHVSERMENAFRIDRSRYEMYRLGMNLPIDSFDALFACWDRQSHLAADLGVSAQHLRMMRLRCSIPVRFWPRLLASAQRRGVPGLSYEMLVRLHVPVNLRCPSAPSISLRSPS